MYFERRIFLRHRDDASSEWSLGVSVNWVKEMTDRAIVSFRWSEIKAR